LAATDGYLYGFIIRYPAGAEGTTGYTYEPWHLRYVGPVIAREMHDKQIATLEQYFSLEPAPDYLTSAAFAG
jgi:D-alanyl-D-alanine carboxypeptidase